MIEPKGKQNALRPRVLYVTYWGAAEPLGQSLVLPAVERLARFNLRLTLVTFEKPIDLARRGVMDAIRDRLHAAGVRWLPLKYHKRPRVPATSFDILQGCVRSTLLAINTPFDIVHARTFLGGLMGLPLARVLGAKFIYHNEGFYPDEQVDGGIWKYGSAPHRVARYLEQMLYDRADGIVALSHRARAVIESLPRVRRKATPVIVVPSCVDVDAFQRPVAPAGRGTAIRLVYIGSIGLRYTFDRVARFAAVARETWGASHLRVLTTADPAMVHGLLRASGLPDDAWSLDAVPHSAIPSELATRHAGLFFLTQGISEHGCSPTKIGEYWAVGLPVVTTPNVSDTDEIIRRERVGIIVRSHSDEAYRAAALELRELIRDPQLGDRCRHAAVTHYALHPACDRQMTLYRRVMGNGEVSKAP